MKTYLHQLNNPLTPSYQDFKSLVKSANFPWFWQETCAIDYKDSSFTQAGVLENMLHRSNEDTDEHENHGYYTHTFLKGPDSNEFLYPEKNSQYISLFHQVVSEILKYNKIDIKTIYRMSVNCEHPTEKGLPDLPHYDHHWPHENLLIYLSNPQNGYTVVEGEKYLGKEDDVILFNGLHYSFPPSKDRRLVSVTTFLR
tara:strand:+ start:666 stop:1259 length:594 start_codon:yes stop_codon:yes gene_type:complete